MIKSKLLHIALFMCIFSLSMNAQVFLSGDEASAALLLEASVVKTQITNAMDAGNFQSDDDYLAQVPEAAADFLLLNALTEVPVTAGFTSDEVKDAFNSYINAVASSQYYSSSEVDNLKADLQEVITQ